MLRVSLRAAHARSNAAVMLIPLSVVIYTVVGGLKATFTSSYLHTVSLFRHTVLCLRARKAPLGVQAMEAICWD
jgi:Na+/pantothenate symporter